jgi:hypothetical protein
MTENRGVGLDANSLSLLFLCNEGSEKKHTLPNTITHTLAIIAGHGEGPNSSDRKRIRRRFMFWENRIDDEQISPGGAVFFFSDHP